MSVHQSDLGALKNLGAASVNILHAIGIHSHADLKSVGAVHAYVRIKRRGINVSKVMLYALEGALKDISWNELSTDAKAALVAESETLMEQLSETVL